MRADSAIRTSKRASGAPRHKRVNAPKAACFRVFERWMLNGRTLKYRFVAAAEPTCK